MDDKKKKKIVRKNFLESLRELGSGVPKSLVKDVAGGVAKSSYDQIFGQMRSSPDQNPVQSNEQKERLKWSGQEFTNLKQQERLIFKQEEQEIRVQIEAIRAELVKIVETTKELQKEIKVAAVQAPVNPGVYHLTFLERLREFIILMRKNIAESKNWLAISNQKSSKKKGYYWAQYQKSGSKFLLSSERYMATQAG